MSCRCKCGWPIHTSFRVTITCPECSAVVECSGEPLPSISGPDKRELLKRRIAIKVKQRRSLVAWIEAYRRDDERGLGDTTERLLLLAKERGKQDLATVLNDLLSQCSCGTDERRAMWNEQHPYQRLCVVCNKPATTVCSHTPPMGMCGQPLCSDCQHEHAL